MSTQEAGLALEGIRGERTSSWTWAEPLANSPSQDVHGDGEANAEGCQWTLGFLINGPHADSHHQEHGHHNLSHHSSWELIIRGDGRESSSCGIFIPLPHCGYLRKISKRDYPRLINLD